MIRELNPRAALDAWALGETPLRSAPDEGLINRTWIVGDPPVGVLQWVNPIFDPRIHEAIQQVTSRLRERSVITPHLIPTQHQRLTHRQEDGLYRLLSWIPGRTLHRVDNPRQAQSMGHLVGRFHGAMEDLDSSLKAPRSAAHDTPRHMAQLKTSLDSTEVHPLRHQVYPLAEAILKLWSQWDGPLDLPCRMGHGDLKTSNLRFDSTAQEALCLLDLDTLGPIPWPAEMADAWRSWCNPAAEDDLESTDFRLDIFEASAISWLKAAPPLDIEEREALVPTVERICLELAARFAADVFNPSYFAEDRLRFPQPGTHNLHKAKGQFRLAAKVRGLQGAMEKIMRSVSSSRKQ